MRWFFVVDYISERLHPIRRAAVLIEPAVNDTLVVGIDGAEDPRKDLEGKPIPNPELNPETPGTEVIECNLPEVLGGDLNLSFHLKYLFLLSFILKRPFSP